LFLSNKHPLTTAWVFRVPGVCACVEQNENWLNTSLKINMEPKNGGLEDDFPFQTGDFQVPC